MGNSLAARPCNPVVMTWGPPFARSYRKFDHTNPEEKRGYEGWGSTHAAAPDGLIGRIDLIVARRDQVVNVIVTAGTIG